MAFSFRAQKMVACARHYRANFAWRTYRNWRRLSNRTFYLHFILRR